jgi:hypothetical protein
MTTRIFLVGKKRAMMEHSLRFVRRKLAGPIFTCSLAVLITPLPSYSAEKSARQDAIVGSGVEAELGAHKVVGAVSDTIFGPVLSGPVTSVNRNGSTIAVLGVDVKVLKSTITVNQDLNALTVGSWVTITGLTRGENIFASQIESEDETFVTGVSPIYVAGEITAVSMELGYIEIAGVQMYVGNLEGLQGIDLSLGTYVEVTGTLPQFGQPVSVEQLRTSEAIVGSGAEAIVGSGAEAIVGSGAEAIVGSGAE